MVFLTIKGSTSHMLLLKKCEALVKISARNEQMGQAKRLLGC